MYSKDHNENVIYFNFSHIFDLELKEFRLKNPAC